MIEYLQSKPLELPTPLTKKTRMRTGEGTLSSNIPRGDLFLTDAHGKSFRLSWATRGDAAPKPRTLPAGKYRLRTYRIEREKEGVSWHISATAHTIQEVEVLAGKNVTVKIDARIHMTSHVRGKRAMMSIVGAKHAGLSIYRAQSRIPVKYRVLDRDKNELASGAMTYG